MKKFLIRLTIVVVLVLIVVFFWNKGFGLFDGKGNGSGTGTEANATVTENESAKTVTIEVKQSTYSVDGAEKTIDEIEEMLKKEDAGKTTYKLVDNYASAKSWDEIKALFTKYEISVIE